ncbi:pregnancy-specific beta-1-glycoprotein 2-like [Antedon mediterranea]|uniref:pregnancy-specific beta-1-glycoprotein 2-like n=1 Tax=Antedon mediterranea TaxID=105859 RepID=UPI003AF89931
MAVALEVTISDVQGFPENSDALLACDYAPTSATGVDISWTRVNAQSEITNLVVRSEVVDEFKSRMELQVADTFQGNAGLIIRNVTKEDAMSYVCAVFSTSDGQEQGITTLQIQWNYKPKITSDPAPDSLQVGDNVTFTCLSEANPTSEIAWLKNNVTIEMDDRFTKNENASTLHIDGLTRDDHALFSCSSTNPVKEIRSDQIEVDIEYEPEMYLNQTGNKVECTSEANPAVYQYEFEVDGKVVRTDDAVYELKGTECVNITCFGTNKIGTGNASDIACPLIIPSTPQPSTGLSGGAVAGIVIGVLALVGAVVVLVLILLVFRKSGVYGESKDSKWNYAEEDEKMETKKKEESKPATGSGGTDTGTASEKKGSSEEEKGKDHRYDEPPTEAKEANEKDWV